MKLDQLEKFIDAGYTKEEILALEKPAEEPKEDSAEEKAKADENAPKHAKANVDLDVFNNLTDIIDNLSKKVNELDASIKKGNILNSNLDLPKEQKAEDVLASILQFNKREE